jgi:hypothetical protein
LLAKVGVQVVRQGPVPELDLETVLHDAVARLGRHEGHEAVRPRGEVIGEHVADAPDLLLLGVAPADVVEEHAEQAGAEQAEPDLAA